MSEKNTKPDLIAFVTTQAKGAEKPFYHEIGAAWAIKNGGYSVKLHALPLGGELVFFPPKETSQ